MAYDAGQRQLVLIGLEWGRGPSLSFSSFAWTGTDWKRLASDPSPPTVGFAVASDAATNGLLVYGGFSQAAVEPDETWVQSAGGWHRVYPAHHPAGNGFLTASAAAAPEGVRLLGRCELWAWNGADWRLLKVESATVYQPYLFDSGTGLMVFGYGGDHQDVNEGVWPV